MLMYIDSIIVFIPSSLIGKMFFFFFWFELYVITVYLNQINKVFIRFQKISDRFHE